MTLLRQTSSSLRLIVLIVSSSAGELEWSLPIALACKNARLAIITLNASADASIQQNQLTRRHFESPDVRVFRLGNMLVYAILSNLYKIVNRLNATLSNELAQGLDSAEKLPVRLFAFFLKRLIGLSPVRTIFCEHPSADQFIVKALRWGYPDALTIYHPHSPHVYSASEARELWRMRPFKTTGLPMSTKVWCIGSCVGDPERLADRVPKTRASLVVGFPMFAKDLVAHGQPLPLSRERVGVKRISVFTRGPGSYLSKNMHAKLVDGLMRSVEETADSIHWALKLHPRETALGYYEQLTCFSNCEVSELDAQLLVQLSDLVIVLWSSVALNAYFQKKPCIEFFSHRDSKEYQESLRGKDGVQYTSSYTDLGIVTNVKDGCDLIRVIRDFQENSDRYSFRVNNVLEFYRERGVEFIGEFSKVI